MRSLTLTFILLVGVAPVFAQKRPAATAGKTPAKTRSAEIGQTALVIDETLSVLREKPSLFAGVIHRIQRGRKVTIQGVAEAEGVKFYKVVAPPKSFGWVQADAVFAKFRPADDSRFVSVMKGYDGWDKVEIGHEFLDFYPISPLRATALLLYGDAVEEMATRLTKSANSQLKAGEIAPSGAPEYSHFLNFNMLDRYRRIGIVFLFNAATKQYHYDGSSWKEILAKYPTSPEAADAKKRLDNLSVKMETGPKKFS